MKRRLGCLSILWLLILVLLPTSRSQFADSRTENHLPYPDCDPYHFGINTGVDQTPDYTLHNGSSFYFYPTGKEEKTLVLHISIPGFLFKASIEGTNLLLERCNLTEAGNFCSIESQGGVKTSDFILPYHWNRVTATISDNQITVSIRERRVIIMSALSDSELRHAKWSVHANQEPSDTPKPIEATEFKLNYLVQLDCNERLQGRSGTQEEKEVVFYDEDYREDPDNNTHYADHSSQTDNSEVTPEEDYEHHIELAIGLVIAAIVLTAIVYFVVDYLKKRRSANLSTEPPVSTHSLIGATKQNKQDAAGHENLSLSLENSSETKPKTSASSQNTQDLEGQNNKSPSPTTDNIIESKTDTGLYPKSEEEKLETSVPNQGNEDLEEQNVKYPSLPVENGSENICSKSEEAESKTPGNQENLDLEEQNVKCPSLPIEDNSESKVEENIFSKSEEPKSETPTQNQENDDLEKQNDEPLSLTEENESENKPDEKIESSSKV